MAEHKTLFGQWCPWILNSIFWYTRLFSLTDSCEFWYNTQIHSEILLRILVQPIYLNLIHWEKLTGFYPLAKHLQMFKTTNADSLDSLSKVKKKITKNQKFISKTKERSRQHDQEK